MFDTFDLHWRALADEGLFAWMLRLAAVGGSVEFLALGLTSEQSRTRLSAARLLAVCHDRDELLDRLVELLSERDPFADDPFAKALQEAEKMSPDEMILINQSGRGDKDIFTVADGLDDDKWKDFIIDKAAQYQAEGR